MKIPHRMKCNEKHAYTFERGGPHCKAAYGDYTWVQFSSKDTNASAIGFPEIQPLSQPFIHKHTTKHLHSGTFVLNRVMFMFRRQSPWIVGFATTTVIIHGISFSLCLVGVAQCTMTFHDLSWYSTIWFRQDVLLSHESPYQIGSLSIWLYMSHGSLELRT